MNYQVGSRVILTIQEDDKLDGKWGTIKALPDDVLGYFQIEVDDAPSWILRLFGESTIPLTKDEFRLASEWPPKESPFVSDYSGPVA